MNIAYFVPCSANSPDLKAPTSNAIVVKLFSLYSYKFVAQEQEMSNNGIMGCGHKEQLERQKKMRSPPLQPLAMTRGYFTIDIIEHNKLRKHILFIICRIIGFFQRLHIFVGRVKFTLQDYQDCSIEIRVDLNRNFMVTRSFQTSGSQRERLSFLQDSRKDHLVNHYLSCVLSTIFF